MNVAPVLFLIFNRPDLTKSTFARIRQIKPKYLYIAADGYRKDRPGEEAECSKTRKITELIDWDCEVHRLYRDENLGCKLAVSSAITWFFEQVEYGIILEDDCLPELSFFQFCTELLDRYKNHDNIGIISGSNPLPLNTKISGSYYYSNYPHIWGWATWRKVWNEYDVSLKSWSGDENDLALHSRNRLVREYWTSKFNAVKAGEIDTWDYQLAFLCIIKRKLSITTKVSLITNTGFDERATHTFVVDDAQPPPVGQDIKFPLKHPKQFVLNSKLDRIEEIKSLGIPSSQLAIRISKCRNFVRRQIRKSLRLLQIKSC